MPLSRRESEVMDLVHRKGRATAAEIREGMVDPPTDAAVRSTLRILVNKGHLVFRQRGPRYVYSPAVPREAARRSAVEHLLTTFFDDSAEGAVTALLEQRGSELSDAQRCRLKSLIDRAAEEGR